MCGLHTPTIKDYNKFLAEFLETLAGISDALENIHELLL